MSQLVVKAELDENDSNETGKLTAFFYNDVLFFFKSYFVYFICHNLLNASNGTYILRFPPIQSKDNHLFLLCLWHLLLVQLIGKKHIGSVSLENGGVFEMAIKTIVGLCPPNAGKWIESIFTHTMELLKDEERVKCMRMRKELEQPDNKSAQKDMQEKSERIRIVRVPRSLSAGMNQHGTVDDLTLPDNLEGNFFILKEKKGADARPLVNSSVKAKGHAASSKVKAVKTTKQSKPSSQSAKQHTKSLLQSVQHQREGKEQQQEQKQGRDEEQLKEDCLSTFEMLNDLLV